MEDLRRRDFSLNAIAISLNPASRGLLLDPTNGLADLEKREVRALSIHSFTNQPVRLLRLLRYSSRMAFRMESRTSEWFTLAIERGLHKSIPPEDVGREVRQLGREEKPGAILKSWESRGLIGAIHPQLARRHPNYDALQRLIRARDDMVSGGYRPRLFAPVASAVLGRLKSRERSAALGRMGFRSAEADAVLHVELEAKKAVKILRSRKTAAPRDAFTFLEKAPLDLLAYIVAEVSNAKAVGKIRNFLHKWKPLHQALPSAAAELEALGLLRGPKFDKVIEDLFQQQLLGKGRKPEDRTRLLRKLAGIKEPPKKKLKEEKKKAAPSAAEKAGKKKPVKQGSQPAATPPAQAAAGAAVAARPAAGSQTAAAPPPGSKAAAFAQARAAAAHGKPKPAKAAKRPASMPRPKQTQIVQSGSSRRPPPKPSTKQR